MQNNGFPNNNLKKIRTEKHLALWGLSTISGVNPTLLSAVEKHNYKPGFAVQTRIAMALGVDVSEIWPINEEKEVA